MRVDGSDPPIRSVPQPRVAELGGMAAGRVLACLSGVVWPLPYLGAAAHRVASRTSYRELRLSDSVAVSDLAPPGWLGGGCVPSGVSGGEMFVRSGLAERCGAADCAISER